MPNGIQDGGVKPPIGGDNAFVPDEHLVLESQRA